MHDDSKQRDYERDKWLLLQMQRADVQAVRCRREGDFIGESRWLAYALRLMHRFLSDSESGQEVANA